MVLVHILGGGVVETATKPSSSYYDEPYYDEPDYATVTYRGRSIKVSRSKESLHDIKKREPEEEEVDCKKHHERNRRIIDDHRKKLFMFGIL